MNTNVHIWMKVLMNHKADFVILWCNLFKSGPHFHGQKKNHLAKTQSHRQQQAEQFGACQIQTY